MKKKNIVKTLVCLTLLSGCASGTSASPSASAEDEVKNYSNASIDDGFDTVIQFQETTTKEIFDSHFNDALSLFRRYNDLFDIYNTYDGMNNLKTINDNAGIQPVEVDPEIISLLQEAKEYYDLSGGEFDITIGSVLNIWHNYREDGITKNEAGEKGDLPSDEELQDAAKHTGWDYVEIDAENSTVYITDPDVSLDVGGIAKGYATEKIAQALEQEGVEHGALNAGGNTRTIGEKYNGTPWNIGIQNPGGSGSLLAVAQSGTMSFVTSGDYERYYIASDGRSYCHIIDPESLYPATRYHSVTIITPDSSAADCLSTTLFTLSFEEGNKVLEEYRSAHPDTTIEAIWIMDKDKAVDSEYSHETGDYYIAYTAGLEGAITWQ